MDCCIYGDRRGREACLQLVGLSRGAAFPIFKVFKYGENLRPALTPNFKEGEKNNWIAVFMVTGWWWWRCMDAFFRAGVDAAEGF